MANIKISALTTYTGTVKDIRWYIMNDSTNSETYKFSGFTSQVIPANGTDSFVTINLPRTYAPDPYMNIFATTNVASSGQYSSVWGGRNNKTNNQFGAVVGGTSNTAGYISGVFVGNGNTANGNAAVVIGGESCTSNNVYGGGIFASLSSTINGGNDNSLNILGSYSSILTSNGGIGVFIHGGAEHRINNFHSTSIRGWREVYGGIIGGQSNTISGPTGSGSSGANAYPLILGGKNNSIFGTETGNVPSSGTTIMNSFGSRIRSVSGATIIGGFNTTISGAVENVVMLGISGRTAEYSDTTHVEHMKTYRTESFSVINGGNVGGNIDVNLSAGTLFTFTMTANTTPNFVNWREGQIVSFFVVNSGTFTIPTITISGGGSVYAKGGTINPTNNGRTSYYGTIINGDMWLDEHLDFQAL